MSDLVTIVAEAWGWTGVDPASVAAVSPFGHLIVRDTAGAYWYFDPEVGSLTCIAGDDAALARHMADPDVKEVWNAEALVELAREKIGEPSDGRCYALKMPAMLGGAYEADNLATLPLAELIRFSGDLARQARTLPDGATVDVKITD